MKQVASDATFWGFYQKIHDSLCNGEKVTKRLDDAFILTDRALDVSLDCILSTLSKILHEKIYVLENEVQALDHLGFIVPSEAGLDDITAVSLKRGFNLNHKIVESQVVTYELGALVNTEKVPTKIYKARNGKGKGIELFIPTWDKETVRDWINQGVGSHFALKVKSEDSLHKIYDVMEEKKIPLMKFMHGKFMNNTQEKMIISYYDVNVLPPRAFCLEFFHAL